MFELTNKQRKYLGLDLVDPEWEQMELKAGPYQPESVLYFEGNILKKQIISNKNRYSEWPFNLETRDKSVILSKTSKGKEKKLTAATLEKYKPDGVAFDWTINGIFSIRNHNTLITYYSNFMEDFKLNTVDELSSWLENYITNSPKNYFDKLKEFQNARRKNIKYKPGDFFAFKVSRTEYGFGRILLDVNKLRKKKLISANHGLQLIMGPPLLVKIYAFISNTLKVDLQDLANQVSLPSDYIMDNHIFYGQYPIIGNKPLELTDYEFPISFGRSIDFNRKIIFLQWGLIHLERPLGPFEKYLYHEKDTTVNNPYGYYSSGFHTRYLTKDILNTINKGFYPFDSDHFQDQWDLRNPKNKEVKREIFQNFGLLPNRSYVENCTKIGIKPMIELSEK